MTILIIGGSGFLGSELVRQAEEAGQATVATYATAPGDATPTSWWPLDLRDAEGLGAAMGEIRPSAVINASSGHADWAVTAQGPLQLAVLAAKYGTRLVHVSSDAVFSGVGRTSYDETCLPDPVTPYGAAKAAAETGVLALHPAAAVARTSLIIGYGRSVHERMVHQMVTGATDSVLFTDDVRCPVHVSDLASALLELASSDASGIQHLAGPDALNRHELGCLIARRDGLDSSLLPTGRRARSAMRGALEVRLDSQITRQRLHTTLRGARQFLTATAE